MPKAKRRQAQPASISARIDRLIQRMTNSGYTAPMIQTELRKLGFERSLSTIYLKKREFRPTKAPAKRAAAMRRTKAATRRKVKR